MGQKGSFDNIWGFFVDTSTTEYLSEKRMEEPPGFWSTEDTEKLLHGATSSDISQSKQMTQFMW